mmetsp:Transcript_29615/g.58976  ORF Transcript_29615/g.58976 Transcript_29615/m.58976 type:complete len:133 (+) Transcript_29615:105-503(+)
MRSCYWSPSSPPFFRISPAALFLCLLLWSLSWTPSSAFRFANRTQLKGAVDHYMRYPEDAKLGDCLLASDDILGNGGDGVEVTEGFSGGGRDLRVGERIGDQIGDQVGNRESKGGGVWGITKSHHSHVVEQN